MIPENIHTSYTTDDFHILTPLLPLPSKFPNCIILPYPRNFIIKFFHQTLRHYLLSFLFATFQQMQPTLPLNCPELVQNIKELRS